MSHDKLICPNLGKCLIGLHISNSELYLYYILLAASSSLTFFSHSLPTSKASLKNSWNQILIQLLHHYSLHHLYHFSQLNSLIDF